MEKFSEAPCRKCGHAAHDVEFFRQVLNHYTGASFAAIETRHEVERLKATCRRCGYSHTYAPLDAKDE